MADTCTSVIVACYANGIPGAANFAMVRHAVPELRQGGVLVAVLYASVDPGMRGWVSLEKNYMTVPLGTVMRSAAVGQVIASDNCDYLVGDIVYGMFGWASHFAADAADVYWKVDPGLAPLSAWLGVLGISGITAWLGFRYFARPDTNETMLVTTAAGSVGSVVGQLAAAEGIRAVGVAGGPRKCLLAETLFGYVHVIDYRNSADLAAELGAVCPSGIDVFFDNVAGAQADAAFALLNPGARVVQCGSASIDSWLPWPGGPRRERDMIVKRLSWHGFVVTDHAARFPAALHELQLLYAAGRLVAREEVLNGLASAPGAIARLYAGHNYGKLCIKIDG